MRRILKTSDRARVVWEASPIMGTCYRELQIILETCERKLAIRGGVPHVAHAYIKGRGPFSMAARHIGFERTITCDLKRWFTSVLWSHVYAGLRGCGETDASASQISTLACPHCHLEVGTCFSPAAANLAAVDLDIGISSFLTSRMTDLWSYTRYSDNLFVSFFRSDSEKKVLDILEEEVRLSKWQIRPESIRIFDRRCGHIPMLGLSVGETSIRECRRTRRKSRAHFHNNR